MDLGAEHLRHVDRGEAEQQVGHVTVLVPQLDEQRLGRELVQQQARLAPELEDGRRVGQRHLAVPPEQHGGRGADHLALAARPLEEGVGEADEDVGARAERQRNVPRRAHRDHEAVPQAGRAAVCARPPAAEGRRRGVRVPDGPGVTARPRAVAPAPGGRCDESPRWHARRQGGGRQLRLRRGGRRAVGVRVGALQRDAELHARHAQGGWHAITVRAARLRLRPGERQQFDASLDRRRRRGHVPDGCLWPAPPRPPAPPARHRSPAGRAAARGGAAVAGQQAELLVEIDGLAAAAAHRLALDIGHARVAAQPQGELALRLAAAGISGGRSVASQQGERVQPQPQGEVHVRVAVARLKLRRRPLAHANAHAQQRARRRAATAAATARALGRAQLELGVHACAALRR
eukprot:scaffold48580_cov56-Phaeocystis_antarctica.AAC.4